MKRIEGGIVAPLGFKANGIFCGIKRSKRKDLMLLVSDVPCVSAGAFTSNQVRAFCVDFNQTQLRNGISQALIVNSGNANCLTGKQGVQDTETMAQEAATLLGLPRHMVLVASTGIIGQPMPMKCVQDGLPELHRGLDRTPEANLNACEAILTTDRRVKFAACEVVIQGKPVRIGLMAKGAGMIHPQMKMVGKKHATMLCFITTDAHITHSALSRILENVINKSFNCMSVDADMSTNDMTLILANGLAKNRLIAKTGAASRIFEAALTELCQQMAKEMIQDAEGATKFVEIRVSGAKSEKDAKTVGLSIASSKLVKTALFGCDPNWGRIAASIGYANATVDAEKLKIKLGPHLVLKGRSRVANKIKDLDKVFQAKKIDIDVDLGVGNHASTIWTTDLSTGYVEFNSAYRT